MPRNPFKIGGYSHPTREIPRVRMLCHPTGFVFFHARGGCMVHLFNLRFQPSTSYSFNVESRRLHDEQKKEPPLSGRLLESVFSTRRFANTSWRDRQLLRAYLVDNQHASHSPSESSAGHSHHAQGPLSSRHGTHSPSSPMISRHASRQSLHTFMVTTPLCMPSSPAAVSSSSSAATRYSSLAQAPRSIILQRSEQNGR